MKLNKSLLLYAITDRHWLNGKTLYSQVELALKGGATMIQIREKDLDENAFLKEAEQIQSLCAKYCVPFIVNDNVELAVKIGADGVHVGQSDMAAKDVRALIGKDKILGVSAQTVEQALEAQKCGADYLGTGAVFPTGSKDDAQVLGVQTLKEICSAVNIPVVAIGGISKDNILELKKSGIAGVSVISAIFAQNDIVAATAELKSLAEQIV
ncbi:thiamine phosphate synthase [uncultured Treponema sp.]|uniref:thiamine phosphate synthase n=1 Tax=uncultured Treponema sp. TaxID=162155 RepID=UPI002596B256|nr:thiamine phosphate synthase [uncultured Treponema sp.]